MTKFILGKLLDSIKVGRYYKLIGVEEIESALDGGNSWWKCS